MPPAYPVRRLSLTADFFSSSVPQKGTSSSLTDEAPAPAGVGKLMPAARLMIVAGVVLLFSIGIIIPNFVAPRFEWASVPLAVHIQVTDQKLATPIGGARVRVPSFHAEAFTGSDGQCEAIAYFRATGIVDPDLQIERSGQMHLHGTLQVSAPGYQTWESSFVSLFGPTYDYVNKGTAVTYAVTLIR